MLPSISKADHTEQAGDDWMMILPASAFAYSWYKDDTDGMYQFGHGFATNMVITHSLKGLINKERPNGNCCDSFPSGHAAAGFHSAFYMQDRYGFKKAWPWWLGAAYVGYSRVESHKHDWADVTGSFVLSYAVSHYFTSEYDPKNPTKPKISFFAGPDNSFSIQADWRW